MFINVFSAFVAAIFIGAGVIVWDAASTMDEKIDDAKSDISKQQNSITGTQNVLKVELSSLKTKVEILENNVREMQSQLSSMSKISATQKGEGDANWQNFPKSTLDSSVKSKELEAQNLNHLDKLLEEYKLK